jgi:hypothetical protein
LVFAVAVRGFAASRRATDDFAERHDEPSKNYSRVRAIMLR